MRSLMLKILILTVTVGFSTALFSASSSSSENIFRRHSYTASDTSKLYMHIRNALAFSSKSKDPNYLKANIDTAELIRQADKRNKA